MDFEDIMLDLECVNMGIPPLSDSPGSVVNIIMSMKSDERKKTTRKIKKLCKKYINLSVTHLKEPVRSHRKRTLESRLGFNNDKQLFNKGTLERRVTFVRGFMMREERRRSMRMCNE